MVKKTEGGVNIQNAREVKVQGDLIGRDKNEDIYVNIPTEQKNGCAYAIEKTFAFIWTLLVAGFLLAVFFGGISAGVFGAFMASRDNQEFGFAIGAVLGVILALGMAIVNAANVKRNK